MATTPNPCAAPATQRRVTTTFKITHNLKPRRLPLLGRLKSDVTLNLEHKLEGENALHRHGCRRARSQRQRETAGALSCPMTYNFSTNFRGEGRIRIENNKDHLRDKTRKIREVRLSGTFFLR